GHKRTCISCGNVSLVFLILVEYRVEYSFALGVGHKFVSVSEKTSCRDEELKSHAAAVGSHMGHYGLSLTELAHDGAYMLFGHIYEKSFDRLEFFAVLFLVENSWGGYREFKSL